MKLKIMHYVTPIDCHRYQSVLGDQEKTSPVCSGETRAWPKTGFVVGSPDYLCRNTQGTISTAQMNIVGAIELEISRVGEIYFGYTYILASPLFASDNLALFVPVLSAQRQLSA